VRVNLTANTTPAVARLTGIGDRVIDVAPAFRTIARGLMADERRRFDTGGYGTWPVLDPVTVRAKAAKGHSPRILEATGTLRRALTVEHAPGQRLEIGRTEMTFGLATNGAAYYGRFHQKGAGVPKRTVISVTPRQRTEISDRVRSFILHTTG
jgi:phage gpG-like protein